MGKNSALGFVLAVFGTTSQAVATDSAEYPLEEIIVTAALRPVPDTLLPGSATVLTETTLRDAGQQHMEDVLALVPNLNWAGDTSRPRYFQVRGVGR
jgi:outer membrane receptor for ferrienterochelin and colicin